MLRSPNQGQVTPLYHQIRLILQQSLLDGDYKPGDLLPTEDSLCDQFGVSKTTVKKALAQLAQEGLVRREQGRGTFVTGKSRRAKPSTGLHNLLQNVSAIDQATEAHFIEASFFNPNSDQRKDFSLKRGELLWRDQRLRLLEGEPICRITALVSPTAAARMGDNIGGARPMLLKIEEAGIEITRAQQSIGATLADPILANQLAMATGGAVVRLRRLVFDGSDQLVEDLTALYRGDRYEYRTELARESNKDDLQSWLI